MGKFEVVSDRNGKLINLHDRMNLHTFSRGRSFGAVASSSKPLVLLLQGPVGPFFHILAKALTSQGYDALKINFNGGDWLFSHGKGTLNFCGTTQAWSDWLEALIRRSSPLAIIMFGDRRPYHRTAIKTAEQMGVRVLCLEEGYARPHFISCEWGGNNARSPLRLGSANTETADTPPEPVELIKGNLFRAMALNAIAYYLSKAVGAPFFFGNEHHRSRGIASETVLWARNFYRKLRYYPENNSLAINLIENLDGRYFVVALQVHDDQQLLSHGRGWTMEQLITETIQSFARRADRQHHLLFKIHPMDRGHKSYRPFIRQLALLGKCEDRVHVLDDGSIGLMIRHSLGLITVNSTSGLLALNHGKPLLALGDALYDTQGLATVPGSNAQAAATIDSFWRTCAAPQKEQVKLFVEIMYRQSLINGSFYLRAYTEATAGRVARRIRAPATILLPEGKTVAPHQQRGFGAHKRS